MLFRTEDGELIAFTEKGLIRTAVLNNMLAGDNLCVIGDKIQQIIDDFNQAE